MTNYEAIKEMSIEELAAYIHNIQESTVRKNKVEDAAYWESFLKKETK